MTDNALPESSHNQPEYSVAEISQALKRTVEQSFNYVRVRGEVSGLKRAASGHIYFSLKDDQAVLNGVCWKGMAAGLAFKPEDGLEVICTGKISTYPGRSNYQIIVQQMEIAGEGALMALLEKRKKELAKEGLFDESRKQELPFMPQTIGVITSPTGAVIRDILHRLTDRFPVRVLVWPVLVQGEGAKEQVTAAIHGFNHLAPENNIPRPDLLIVARGGGSLEDLWAFNEEIVVRAVAASTIPIISAVGHETDTTLIDYVADKRAPTPTAAAEIAVPVRQEWLLTCYDYQKRLLASISRSLEERRNFLAALARGLLSPRQLLEAITQKLDDWSERLRDSLPLYLQQKQQALQLAASQLQPSIILRYIELQQQHLYSRGNLRAELILQKIRFLEQQFGNQSKLLESYHYKKVLQRGFALVHDEHGRLVTSKGSVSTGMAMDIEFADGKTPVIAGGKTKRKKTSSKQDDTQESLF